MRLATREQIKKLDHLAKTEFGLSEEQLIEMAGKALADKFHRLSSRFRVSPEDRIAVWCGPGNNGADGRVMAQHLQKLGYNASVAEGTLWNLDSFDILIDAVFGVGLNRELSEEMIDKVHELNQSKLRIFAIDTPSGLCANTGQVLGACVKAAVTLTLHPPKPGLFLNQGPAVCGKLFNLKFGFPKALLQRPGVLDTYLVDRKLALRLLPPRSNSGNKTKFGHLLVIAGSPGLEGAALLACEAAARLGCGYVSLCSLSDGTFRKAKPDFLQLTVENFLSSDLKKYHAVVFGPGLGVNNQSWVLLQHLLKKHPRVLVDADGLSLLAKHQVSRLPAEWVLTPHAGELSRLTEFTAATLESDRLKAVKEAQVRFGSVVLLKGYRTVLRAAEQSFVIFSGNVALAKAGTGDVLSGFIGSLMAQGQSTAEAAALGAYLHGRIADDWLREGHSSRTLMASDLPERIDATLRSLKKHP